jgi:hypothetical protein
MHKVTVQLSALILEHTHWDRLSVLWGLLIDMSETAILVKTFVLKAAHRGSCWMRKLAVNVLTCALRSVFTRKRFRGSLLRRVREFTEGVLVSALEAVLTDPCF